MNINQITHSEWEGYLTPTTLEPIVERIRDMLRGQRFTIAEVIASPTPGSTLPPKLHVKTGQTMRPDWAGDSNVHPGTLIDIVHYDDTPYATCGFHIGGAGLLVLSSKLDQSYVDLDSPTVSEDTPFEAKCAAHVEFKGTCEMRFTWRAPARNRVQTVIAIE